MNDAVLKRAIWTCKLCEASGAGGYLNYFLHYTEAHSSLEQERRRVI